MVWEWEANREEFSDLMSRWICSRSCRISCTENISMGKYQGFAGIMQGVF